MPHRQTWYGIRFSGYLKMPACPASKCYFRLTSDDGAILTIQSTVVVNHDGLHSPSGKIGAVFAAPGWHKYKIDWYQGPHTQIALGLEVSVDNGVTYSVVPKTSLKYEID